MALTAAQQVDVRRYAGYAVVADQPVSDSLDIAYVGQLMQVQLVTLNHRLNNLSPEEETVLTDVYLTNLATLESAIPAMSDDLDTNAAGTWVANPQEFGNRVSLFNKWRREMCGFLGVDPGPNLGSGGCIVRV